MSGDVDNDVLRILAVHGESLEINIVKADATSTRADAAIGVAERLLEKLGHALPARNKCEPAPFSMQPPRLRAWEDIVADAHAKKPGEISFVDILDADDLASATGRLSRWRSEFAGVDELTSYDYAVAGSAGILAGLADILLVKIPKHPRFLGAEGGWLSDVLREKFGEVLPQHTIFHLEQDFRVCYDPSTSTYLRKAVAGLAPATHRMSSLGHDPILGWYFGVRDILAGGFTAIGSDGRLVIQSGPGADTAELGVEVFVKIVEAFQTVAGHLLSDVGTTAGLPPPLFGLLQFFQRGGIGDLSVAEIARKMYRSGYDFRHFLAGGVTVAIIEVFVRTAWVVRELSEGKTLADAIPVGNMRLKNTLFLSHSVATAVNAGKVAVTQNPLSINWAQWLAFFGYVMPQMHWLLIGRNDAQAAFIQKKLDIAWMELDDELASVWAATFGAGHRAVL